ncbi:MAG: hypothetical protein HQL76_18000 [Magnetococcales bacterium]|nr:hypothetical protein [Magnetococcales bacterium]
MMFEAFLAHTPYRLVIVNNGRDAVAQVENNRFDLLDARSLPEVFQ